MPLISSDSTQAIHQIEYIDTLPALLQMLGEESGLGLIGVARVTESTWTACAVKDSIDFGLTVGAQVDTGTTFCAEVRKSRLPIMIEHISVDPVYKDHATPKVYGFESIITIPIVVDDEYFGSLFGIDRSPKPVSTPAVTALFNGVARVISLRLAAIQVSREDTSLSSGICEQFISALADDMRRPVDAIVEAADMLEKKCLDTSSKELAAGVQRRARRFGAMADQMRDAAVGNSRSGMQVRMEETKLDPLFNRMLSQLRTAHPHRRIITNIAIREPVRCDPSRVCQLASMLLESALAQAGPVGPVSMAATIEDGGLSIDVWNGGDPIPAERLVHLFAKSWQPIATGLPMDSLSLHVCRLIVDAHHGSILATSTVEEGTQFSVRMPTIPADGAAAGSAQRHCLEAKANRVAI